MHPEIIKAWLHDVVVKRPFDEDEEQIYNHSQQATRAQAIMSSPPQTPSPFKKRKLRGNADNDKMPEAQDSAQTQTQTRVVGAPDAASPRASTSASVSSSFAVPAYYPPPSWTLAYAISISQHSQTPCPSRGSRLTTSTTTTTTGGRSASPVNRVAMLASVGGGILYEPLGDSAAKLSGGGIHYARTLLGSLQAASSGVRVVPRAVQEKVEMVVDMPLLPQWFNDEVAADTQLNRDPAELLAEFDEVLQLSRASQRCERMSEQEAEWNNAVHGHVLRLAMKRHGGDRSQAVFRYIIDAKINPVFLPIHSASLITPNKMVDYVICLGSDAGPDGLEHPHPSSSPPPSLHSRIDELLSSSDDDDHGPAAGSVNHTVYPALRRMPIAISIETEVVERTEEEARVQLGIWVAAQAKRIHMLLGAAARQRIRGTGMGTEAEVEEDVRRILQRALFPLLFVQTDTWTVYLARVSLVDNALPSTGGPLRVHIYTSFVLGSTSSIVGIYTLLSGLGVLLDWVTTEYRRWWEAILDFAEGKEIGVVG